jgi:hypothetical protein
VAMDFPLQLSPLLEDDGNSSFTYEAIEKWCDEIEGFLSTPAAQDQKSDDTINDNLKESTSKVSQELYRGIIKSILPAESFDDADSDAKLKVINLAAKKRYLENKEEISIDAFSSYVRASKNLLRWDIQIYFERNGPQLPSLVRCLKLPSTIELLVCVLESEEANMDNGQQDRARNISLHLFYATYSAFPGDDDSRKALHHLIMKLSFTNTVLHLLTQPCTAALMLSLVRNVHNAMVSLQGAANVIVNARMEWKGSPSNAVSWVPKNSCDITFTSICIDLMRWALESEPAFPGDEDDRRTDLITEILGAFYALKMGQAVHANRGNEALLPIVLDILRHAGDNDKRIVQCKTSIISLLMDSDRSMGTELLKNGAFDSLLRHLETQVRNTVVNTRIDDSAAAAVVPILVVLNKFATANAEVCQAAKLFIFPAEAEEAFQEKVKEHQRTTNKRNMSPLDAPKGTLRWNLISLMTWPQGHIKRCTGELLWTLCSSNAAEFVHRIGFGNGMPLLGVKGIVQMPQQGGSEPRVEVL